jgi:phosphoheptose isomerase
MTEAEFFAAILYRSAELKRRIATELAVPVIATVDTCEASLRGGGKLLFCGNGGSAGDSMHLATELLVRLRPHVERDSWPGISLTFDPTTVLAAGNDYGFERVFERPLRGLGHAGNVLFGITTSSRSANVIAATGGARDGHCYCWPAGRFRQSSKGVLRSRPYRAGHRNCSRAGVPYCARPCRLGALGGKAISTPSYTSSDPDTLKLEGLQGSKTHYLMFQKS